MELAKDKDIHKGKTVYTVPTNDCDDYAHRLEAHLRKKGYETRFIVLYKPNDSGELEAYHAVVGVLLDSPRELVVIDAQEAEFYSELDNDNNGQITYETELGVSPTDGTWRIEVYEDLKAALDAGAPID